MSQLGLLGFGASKNDAAKAFEAAYQKLLDLNSNRVKYPKSLAKTDVEKYYAKLRDDFTALWAAVSKYKEGVTDWGKYAKKAQDYGGYFEDFSGRIMSAVAQTGERPVVSENPDVPDRPPGVEKPIDWVMVGGIAAGGVALWIIASMLSKRN